MKNVNARVKHVLLNEYGKVIKVIEYINIDNFKTFNFNDPNILEDEINSRHKLPSNEFYELDAFQIA